MRDHTGPLDRLGWVGLRSRSDSLVCEHQPHTICLRPSFKDEDVMLTVAHFGGCFSRVIEQQVWCLLRHLFMTCRRATAHTL